MIVVRSLLKEKNGFIPVELFSKKVKSPFYVEGAIELSIDGTILLGITEWDLIDQLWAYIVDALKEVDSGKDTKIYFPDQPIELIIVSIHNSILQINVHYGIINRVAYIDRSEFLKGMRDAGIFFFSYMTKHNPDAITTYQECIAELKRLSS